MINLQKRISSHAYEIEATLCEVISNPYLGADKSESYFPIPKKAI